MKKTSMVFGMVLILGLSLCLMNCGGKDDEPAGATSANFGVTLVGSCQSTSGNCADFYGLSYANITSVACTDVGDQTSTSTCTATNRIGSCKVPYTILRFYSTLTTLEDAKTACTAAGGQFVAG